LKKGVGGLRNIKHFPMQNSSFGEELLSLLNIRRFLPKKVIYSTEAYITSYVLRKVNDLHWISRQNDSVIHILKIFIFISKLKRTNVYSSFEHKITFLGILIHPSINHLKSYLKRISRA
jgi:hypothetical protein